MNRHLRIAGPVLMVILAGCHNDKLKSRPPPPKDPPRKLSIQAERSEVTKFSSLDKSIIWKFRPKHTVVSLVEKGGVSGEAKDIDGDFYDKGNHAATFHADSGIAPPNTNVLTLKGSVKVTGASRGVELNCDEVQWDPDKRVIRAKGNVVYEEEGLKAGPYNEIWATPNLGIISTPNMFEPAGKPPKP